MPRAFEPDYGMNLKRLPIPVNPYEVFKCDVPNMSTSLFFVVNDALSYTEKTLPDGVILGNFRDYPELVERYLGTLADTSRDGLTAFNTAFAQDGVLLYVPRGVIVEKPIQLINILRSDVPLLVNRRVLMVCDHTMDEVNFLATQVIEVFAGRDSVFDLYELEETHTGTTRLSNLYVRQEAGSNVLLNGMTLHNGITRNTTEVALDGRGAEVKMLGMAIGDKQYVSFTVDSIPAGETANVSFQVTVNADATEDDTIKNVALIKTAEDEDPQDPSTWNPDEFVPSNEVDHPLSPWVETEKEVNVDKGEGPRLVVTKTSDKDSYERKETGTYTITVTNDRENTTAENVVITDAFETTGMTIDQGSIKVTGPDGNVITPVSITMNESGNGFTIVTGASLAGGQSMTATYDVTFTDKALIGEDVKNDVTVTSDNTDASTSAKTVKVTKPDKDKANTPDKTDNDGGKNGGSSNGNGGSNRGSGNVQTSDILIGILIAAVVILTASGGVYFYKKKKAAKGNTGLKL